jgi:hypothetical protein
MSDNYDELDDLDNLEDTPYSINKRYTKENKSHVLDKRMFYSNAIKSKVNILSINPKNTFFYGSAILASLASIAGDYDIWEVFKKEDNIENIVKGIQKIIKQFTEKQKFFIEFKCGLDQLSKLDIGYYEDGEIKNYDYNKLIKIIKDRPYLKSIKKYIKKDINLEKWMQLYDENRKQYTLRWTPEEVLKNKKIMPSGKIMTLEKGLIQPIITKIETIFDINGKFIAFSNYFDIGVTSENMEIFKQSLQLNTLRMLKDKKYMKVIKRIFAQEKNFYNDNKTIDLIYNFLISDTGRLNKINNDLKALQEIINSKKGIVPMKTTIKKELDSLIDDLATIQLIQYDLEKLDFLLNEAIDNIKYKVINKILDELIKEIDNIVKKEAYKFLIKSKLLPLKDKYLPTSTKLLR